MRIATCRFRGPLGNATARAVFRATAEYAGATMRDPSGSGALRFELMEHKTADDSGDFSALTVHWHQPPEADPGLPGWLAAEVDVRSAQRLRTVFPERSRWKEAVPIAEPGELGEVGRIALLVQRSVLVAADADAADQLRRGWADLGYNALGEPGVVRCDLFVYDDDPLTFVARKVFRGPQALRAHEGSDHFVRWREVCSRCPARPAACVCQPHTNAALACHTRMPHAHAARACRTRMPHPHAAQPLFNRTPLANLCGCREVARARADLGIATPLYRRRSRCYRAPPRRHRPSSWTRCIRAARPTPSVPVGPPPRESVQSVVSALRVARRPTQQPMSTRCGGCSTAPAGRRDVVFR